ncbi:transcriptional regulator family: Fungal Specific TF [Penicillium macrosclerotiorum]|uniref:transcriptional regulator family: Fungal Specific TF n=1 Tax=Penicillium macrosclerotiorum TaxID=303699 RepID=UPI0025470637|nr:transcriptional regulator family: Fungal Specific TF [Penicillium macrosclerotiorum]KAJ5683515.1 transcriptional regulator family: Fungal Specific TF [Penicillium macrosclerotiorum]
MDPASNAPRGANVRSACDLCRSRKIRCDKAQPACENCQVAGLPCTFTAQPTAQRKSLRQELTDSRARVQELEDALAAVQNNSDAPNYSARRVAPASSTATTSPGSEAHFQSSQSSQPCKNYIPDTRSLEAAVAAFQWHIAFCGLGNPLSTTRAAFYSQIHRQTGCTFDLDNFLQGVASSFKANGLRSEKKSTTSKWPSTPLVQRCVEHYASNGLYSMFPFADAEALRVLIQADVLNHPHTTRAANRACLAAFTANITVMHRHDPAFSDSDPDAYAQAALSLIPDILMEASDLRTLEAVMMLVIYLAPLGQPQSSELLLGIAVQALYTLGGHKFQSSPETPSRSQQSRHLRALFWLCYGTDSEFSIRKGQPPLLNETHCDLDLPVNYAQKSSEHHFYWKPLSSKELLYPSDIRLNLIKSKIYRLLYSEKNSSRSEARRIQLIRELDLELSDLRAEYPVECRPDAFATEKAPDYLFHDLSIRGISIHLEYYYCLGKIHGANTSFNIPTSKTWSPLPSSDEICYEAARSTLIYIGRVRHYINYHTFWLHAQFVLTAVITLFRFLLMIPSAPNFARDLQVLDGTADLFAGFTMSEDPERNCFPPFYITHAFIKELVFLARRAYDRSRKN